MASFSAQPAAVCSAYRPVKFAVQSAPTADAIEKLLIRVYNAAGNILLATYRKDWLTRFGTDPTYTYNFEFDIQGIIQSLLDPLPSAKSGAFIDLQAKAGYAHGASISVYVKVNVEYRDTDNLMVTDGTDLTSGTITVFNLIQQHEETQGLAPYIDSTLRRLLTDMPDLIDIRPQDAFGLAFIVNQNAVRIKLTVRKKDGTVVTGLSSLTLSGYAGAHNKKVAVVGVGPRQIFEYIGWIGTPVTINSDVATYTVEFCNSSNVALTESVTFNLIEACPGHELRLQWMNIRGGADAYTVDAKRRDVVEVRSNRAEKPLVWDTIGETTHDPNQRGKYRLEVNRVDTWEVETRILDEDISGWLAGLLASPEVVVEQQYKTYYLPAIITDGKIISTDSEDVGSILKFTVEVANDQMVQRN